MLITSLHAQSTTIEIWQATTNESIAVMNSLIEEHFTPNTGIKVNVTNIPGGTEQWNKVLLAMATNDTLILLLLAQSGH